MTSLRMLRAVAEHGSFSAAAQSVGYTQSAVSRQMAALEKVVGHQLVERRAHGVVLTRSGRAALVHISRALDEIDSAACAVADEPPQQSVVRVGWFPSAGAALIPQVITELGRSHPYIEIRGREAPTAALTRALRAGTIDLALISLAPPYRPPDTETPALTLDIVSQRALRLAVATTHPFAARPDAVDISELTDQRWIAGPPGSQSMGVWPGLDARPHITHTTREWLTKLTLVAAGAGITTIPVSLVDALPHGVCAVDVRGGPTEHRRIVLASQPRYRTPAEQTVCELIHRHAH